MTGSKTITIKVVALATSLPGFKMHLSLSIGQGSPGMETGRKDDYQVIAFRTNGQQSVFREHSDY